ncbi:MAG: HAD-IIB family hydrolase [Erysipelotrichaceae bacterium]|nr:HAD-IIB family hydrolase [Erysipelotrichaceae bacterium]
MFENIKVIAADIDGTLAKTAVNPSAYTLDTIKAIQDKGILFGLASGRPADDLTDKYKIWNAHRQFDFIIGWNGCQLIDFSSDEHYEFNRLKKEWIKEIIDFMAEFDANIHMYLPGRYIASSDTDRAWYSAYKNRRKYEVTDDLSVFYGQDNCGIMFRYDLKYDEAIHEKLKLLKDKPYIGFNTQKDLLEFSHKNSNKGYALKQYCAMHGISMDDVLSFGDTDNDNEMLKISHGVCLSDGNENTKKIAEYVTEEGCAQDGFAKFVRRHVL